MEQGFIFIVLFLVGAFLWHGASGNMIFETQLSIVNKPHPTSVEFQVQRVIAAQVYESCFGHVVHYRFVNETEQLWHFANITEKMGGRFVLSGLESGKRYQVRAACKMNKDPPVVVGEWSTPVSFMTPLLAAVQKEVKTSPEPPQPKKDEKITVEDENNGGLRKRDTLTFVTILIFFAKIIVI